MRLTQRGIYALLTNIQAYNDIYRRAGAVHGCGLCHQGSIVKFVEDVGRHNALDKLIGALVTETANFRCCLRKR